MTPTLSGVARLETLRLTLGTAARMIRDLGTVDRDAVMRAAREDPPRWEPLLDQLSAAVEPGAGTVAGVLAALSGVLDG